MVDRIILGGTIVEMSELTIKKPTESDFEDPIKLTFRVEFSQYGKNEKKIIASVDVKAYGYEAEYISSHYHIGQPIVMSGVFAYTHNNSAVPEDVITFAGVEFIVEYVYYTNASKPKDEQSGFIYNSINTTQYHFRKIMAQRDFNVWEGN